MAHKHSIFLYENNCCKKLFFYDQAGWKESHSIFTSELKNLTAVGITSLGNALKSCFDLLNVNRMQSGIDTYGQVCIMQLKRFSKFQT